MKYWENWSTSIVADMMTTFNMSIRWVSTAVLIQQDTYRSGLAKSQLPKTEIYTQNSKKHTEFGTEESDHSLLKPSALVSHKHNVLV